ncbi:GDSL esterase/lipase [Senna tora]|uniref:GDSL esterase/lipase n=1 Tax=Senna tora TaxID=362788 RepID=A0A834TVC3_9FABA|nr:GDSL esterase/lipase [Senna tora]
MMVSGINITLKSNIPAIIVFGDSSVDSGNNNGIATILKSNFRPYGRDFPGGRPTGRFCNGRVPPDFISEALGLKPFIPAYLDPMYTIKDFATGVCFASAGTGYDNATSAVLNVIPLWKELEYYKEYQTKLRSYVGVEKANRIIGEALYLMSIGTNDFLENYYVFPTRRSQFSITQYQDFLAGIAEDFVRELYALGARKIALTGLIPIGCLPLERAVNMRNLHACNEEYNQVALEFNKKLDVMESKLNRELPMMTLVAANAYDIYNDVIRRPSSYGDVAVGIHLWRRQIRVCRELRIRLCDERSDYGWLLWHNGLHGREHRMVARNGGSDCVGRYSPNFDSLGGLWRELNLQCTWRRNGFRGLRRMLIEPVQVVWHPIWVLGAGTLPLDSDPLRFSHPYVHMFPYWRNWDLGSHLWCRPLQLLLARIMTSLLPMALVTATGFEVAEKACCSTGTFEMSYLCSDVNPHTCRDANKYVFWDAFHPSEKTNRIVANYLIQKLASNF